MSDTLSIINPDTVYPVDGEYLIELRMKAENWDIFMWTRDFDCIENCPTKRYKIGCDMCCNPEQHLEELRDIYRKVAQERRRANG